MLTLSPSPDATAATATAATAASATAASADTESLPHAVAAVVGRLVDNVVSVTQRHDALNAALRKIASKTLHSYTKKTAAAAAAANQLELRLPPQQQTEAADGLLKPVPVRVGEAPSAKPAPGFERTGLLPSVLRVVDTVAAQAQQALLPALHRRCVVCNAALDEKSSRRACSGQCGILVHKACVQEGIEAWYCERWRCQARRRRRQAHKAEQRLETEVYEKELVPTLEATSSDANNCTSENAEAAAAKTWRILNACFEPPPPDHARRLLRPSYVPAEMYEVPVPEVHFREIWAEEDRGWTALDSTTPRGARYHQRTPPSDSAAQQRQQRQQRCSTSVDRVSILWNVHPRPGEAPSHAGDGDHDAPLASWCFRALERRYAETSGLIQSSEFMEGEQLGLGYVFPPALYEPISARFYMPMGSSPFDVRPPIRDGEVEPLTASTVGVSFDPLAEAEHCESEVDQNSARSSLTVCQGGVNASRLFVEPLQQQETDDEVCCELWVLRRHLEGQIRRNNAVKRLLLRSALQDAAKPRKRKIDARNVILSRYDRLREAKRTDGSVVVALAEPQLEGGKTVNSPDPLESDSVSPEQPKQEESTVKQAPAAVPAAAVPQRLTLEDMCRIMAERHVLMSRPPTLATLVDCLTSDMLLEEELMATDAAEAHVRHFQTQRQMLQQQLVAPLRDSIAVREVMRTLVDKVEKGVRLERHNDRVETWSAAAAKPSHVQPEQRGAVSPGTSHVGVVPSPPSSPPGQNQNHGDGRATRRAGRCPPVRHCVCSRPGDATRCYISCDFCEQWLHAECAGLGFLHTDYIRQFACQQCDGGASASGRETQVHRAYLDRIATLVRGTKPATPGEESLQPHLQEANDSIASLTVRVRRCTSSKKYELRLVGVFVDDLRVLFDSPQQCHTRTSLRQADVKVAARIRTCERTEAAGEAAYEAPDEASDEAPVEAPDEAACEAPGEAPDEAAYELPGEAPDEAACEAPGEAPDEAACEAPPVCASPRRTAASSVSGAVGDVPCGNRLRQRAAAAAAAADSISERPASPPPKAPACVPSPPPSSRRAAAAAAAAAADRTRRSLRSRSCRSSETLSIHARRQQRRRRRPAPMSASPSASLSKKRRVR